MAVTVTKPVDLRAPWACDIVKGNGFLDHGILEAVEFWWDCSTISAMNQGSVSQQVTLRLCLLLCCWETAPDFCNNLWLSRKLWSSFPVLDVGTSYGDLFIYLFFWSMTDLECMHPCPAISCVMFGQSVCSKCCGQWWVLNKLLVLCTLIIYTWFQILRLSPALGKWGKK